MRINIARKATRSQLRCVRADGSAVVADLGPNLPYHDLAHYVVERRLGLQDGFFGHIARGYSPAQLSDKQVIMSLGTAPYRAEILARALGSLATGACRPEQFEELVNAELKGLSLSSMRIAPETLEAMIVEFNALVEQYRRLPDGARLSLEFDDAES